MLHNPEATRAALDILRSGNPFQWYVITLLALTIYVYLNEISKKNWKGIAAGLSLYMVHWHAEIVNALIQHFTGHALWTVPCGTAFLLLVGVGVEISLMFAIAGLAFSKVLTNDPKEKILGINNRLLFALVNAAIFAIAEIFLVKTPTFVWVYPWWGALPVFLTVYIPFFVVSFYCYDCRPRTQFITISTMAFINIIALVLFAGILKWI
ncbi:MAG: hypothetical protein J7J85_02535 [Deltaproteobacteria bacterium]|nr:hypothetical protein [Deltaproteobacteria bacterium]